MAFSCSALNFHDRINEKKFEDIDWLIPNRYYLMPETGRQSQFGKRAIRNMKIKRAIGGVLRLGRPIPDFQKITPYETLPLHSDSCSHTYQGCLHLHRLCIFPGPNPIQGFYQLAVWCLSDYPFWNQGALTAIIHMVLTIHFL